MKNIINSLTRETFETDAKRWLNIIRYNESGTIIQIQNDAVYRVHQILANKQILKETLGLYYKKYILGYVSLSENRLIGSLTESLIKLAKSKKIKLLPDEVSIDEILNVIENKGYDIGLFINYGANIFLNESDHNQLFEIETIIRKHKKFSVIIFSEVDIMYEKYNKLVNQCSSIFTHIIKYPLYSQEDSYQFIKYNESLWKVKFPEKIKKEIVEKCGGYLWLIRQALRLLRDEENLSPDQVFSHELMIKKLEVIWQKLTEEEKEILRKIAKNILTSDDKNSHQFMYLKTIKLVRENKNELTLGIPLFKYIINKEKIANKLFLKEDVMFFNDIDISYQLTKSELRIIKLLVQNKNKLITRNEIAQKVWGANWEHKYSDWAIDRLIYRLRLKLKKIGYEEGLIKTYKARGIMFG